MTLCEAGTKDQVCAADAVVAALDAPTRALDAAHASKAKVGGLDG